jgi:UDP-N-acetylmuramoylalanine--D-glutamate ligase
MKKIAILGGGESGVGAALLAQKKGFDVFLSDKGMLGDKYREVLVQHQIVFEEGQHTEEMILDATEVIKSPGIPDKAPLIQKLQAQGTPIVSEIEFAARYTAAKIIAITGSNGKTTTTLLTYHLLKTAGFNVGLGGNVGESFAWQVLENNFDYYVLELSSFQLDNCYNFKADVAVLLNITPDHLDRYNYDFQNYVDAKFRLLQNMAQTDDFIYFAENEAIQKELNHRSFNVNHLPIYLNQKINKGAFFENGRLQVSARNTIFEIPMSDLPIKGIHNAINSMAAVLAAQAVGLESAKIKAGLLSFENAAHRLEPISVVDGVQYVNDSKATNVDSVFYALGSFDKPIVWIAGGQDKGNDYTQIENLVRQKVKALVCLGKDNSNLQHFFAPFVQHILATQDITEAVSMAQALATEGDVVLLSPACASFDLFKNYMDRGDQFREAVARLPSAN